MSCLILNRVNSNAEFCALCLGLEKKKKEQKKRESLLSVQSNIIMYVFLCLKPKQDTDILGGLLLLLLVF